MRYFRTADAGLYEAIRLQLDAAWGHPTPDGKTLTCLDPLTVAPRDGAGRVLVAVRDEFLTYEPAASLLPQILASGAAEEISEATYQAAVQPPSLQTAPASAFPAGTTTINGSLGGRTLL